MLLLTDCPENLNDTVYDGGVPAHPDTRQAAFWSALHPSAASMATALPGAGPPSCLAVVRESARSQFDAVMEALEQGVHLPDGAAAIGLTGQKFHGQRGRPWQAAAGNIHLTVYRRLERPAGELGAGLSMLPTVAVMETVRTLYGEVPGLGIKWVNDVLINGRKVAGVLTSTQARGKVLEHVVFGIGMNVGAVPQIEATPFVPRAGCLAECTGRSDLGMFDVLPVLLTCLDRGFQTLREHGPSEALALYREASLILGREVEIRDDCAPRSDLPAGQLMVRGTVQSIEPDLALILAGHSEPVRRGRLMMAPGHSL